MMWLVVLIIAVVAALFFSSDCDLPLFYLPYQLENSFNGKVVWITGASSGIGAQLARDLTKAGANVIISARRVEKLEEVAKSCEELGESPMVLPLDVTDLEAQKRAYSAVIAKYGRVDSLVLNAGKSQRNLAIETDLSSTQELMHLNFLSIVALTKLALPDMMARKDGQIVVVSSLSGIIGTPLSSSYSASKFALHGYFNALRAEVSKDNVGVTIVCPGPVESEIHLKSIRNPENPVSAEHGKMPTARCTYLMAKAMHLKMMEVWIADQPVLLVTYIVDYMPYLSKLLFTKVLGPARVEALKSGANLYDTNMLIGGKAQPNAAR